ncbi:MAG: flavodoxin-dependent (E)-4-hydroxy-3-methylbut-2-enyl-diphosphate synthase [Coriobacteriales bacterium]|nr:flavodoxin-dependent (E)-4-hydroxy-3-methylbut-2-enyl-diphosphate synthase [Coriobacteriales bacterium]
MTNPNRIAREKTRSVKIGDLIVGGGAPVVVQSMLNTKPDDLLGAREQVEALAEAGCRIARIAVPSKIALECFALTARRSPIPIVADIHFDYKLAIAAVEAGAAAIRINPGNIGGFDKVDQVIEACRAAEVPIRIGVNAGSLDPEVAAEAGLSAAEQLAASAIQYVEYFEAHDFEQIVVSAKAHDVATTVTTYRLLAERIPEVPLHLGVTEAGGLRQGTIKSACAIGALLLDGIGDTIRVSLTADPLREVEVGYDILRACGLYRAGVEIVSCPTCGRTQVDLERIATEVERRLASIKRPLSVAVMGCVVNGPGEAAGANIGAACGRGSAQIFVDGEVRYSVPEEKIADALLAEAEQYPGVDGSPAA